MFQQASNFLHKMEHNLTHKEGADGWTHICGGASGKAFEFVDQQLILIGVKGRYGDMVDQLQFLFVNPQTGQFQSTPPVGGTGGVEFCVECPQGQNIAKIHIWSGTKIDAIQFVTNMGMQTAKYGGSGGSKHVIDAKGKKFCGVKGLYTNVLDQICFGISS